MLLSPVLLPAPWYLIPACFCSWWWGATGSRQLFLRCLTLKLCCLRLNTEACVPKPLLLFMAILIALIDWMTISMTLGAIIHYIYVQTAELLTSILSWDLGSCSWKSISRFAETVTLCSLLIPTPSPACDVFQLALSQSEGMVWGCWADIFDPQKGEAPLPLDFTFLLFPLLAVVLIRSTWWVESSL